MKNLYKAGVKAFDSVEHTIRISLSHHPLIYTFIGGIGIVLFWKGVWDIADMFQFLHGWVSLVVGTAILIFTGLFVSFFVGDSVVLSGIKKEEKEIAETEREVKAEMLETEQLMAHIQNIEQSLEVLRKHV